MAVRTRFLFLGICLLAKAVFGRDAIELIAKGSLGLDLSYVPFGTVMQTNGEFGIATPPRIITPFLTNDAGLAWVTNATCAKYHHDFPTRELRYGFHDGRLAAVRISISRWGFSEPKPDVALLKQRDKEISDIQKQVFKWYDDGKFHTQWGEICGGLEMQISIVEKSL
jgi:hypothetical protein